MIRINATKLGRELLYPLSEQAVVYAMLFYWALFLVARKAGMFGLWLLIGTIPAYLRYLLFVLEARANGRQAPVPSIEMFTPWDNFWTLTPLIHLAVFTWAGIWIAGFESRLATTFSTLALLLILPASLAVLAVTHSPAASLNPLDLFRMMRACGPAYFVVPAVLFFMSIAFAILYLAGVSPLLMDLATNYEFLLLFTLTGAVIHSRDIALQVDIDDPVEPTGDDLARDLEEERRKVANHAYGFISRGNRSGGFAHIREWLENEVAPDEAWRWFFLEMMKWQDKNPALFFAQEYLKQLLEWGLHSDAIKLVSRCLHESERWRPLPGDRDQLLDLLGEKRRDDLLRKLNN